MAECIASGSEPSSISQQFREQRRKDVEEERLQQRQQAVNRIRKNLPQVENELNAQNVMTEEQLAKAFNKIKQGNKTSHLDLRKLKQALYDPKNSSLFLRNTGSLQAVVGHLTGRNALHQLEAAYICCNLATGDDFACRAVTNAAGPYLVEYLDSPNTALQVACLWTLGNLAGGSPKSFKILQSQGFVDRLSNCLRSPHQEVIEAATGALCLVLRSSMSDCQGLHLSLEERQKLAAFAVRLDCCRENVDWLLYLLSCESGCDEIFLENMIPNKCIDFLEKLSHDAPMKLDNLHELRSATALLRTAANLCSEKSGRAAQAIISNSTFITVLNDLIHATHPHLRLESEWLARNLLNHSSNEVVSMAKLVKVDVVMEARGQSHTPIKRLVN